MKAMDNLLLERAREPTGYRLEPVAGAFARIVAGDDPWLVLGSFLDDWYRAEQDQRSALVADAIKLPGDADGETRRWAALFTAVVEWLCWTSDPQVIRRRGWTTTTSDWIGRGSSYQGILCERGSWSTVRPPSACATCSPTRASSLAFSPSRAPVVPVGRALPIRA